jgi:flavin-dependent dehydrogenase
MYDVVIIGAGLAGLECARLLSRAGVRVLLVDRKRSVEERVHTTGIFVRKTLEDFDLPDDCLGPDISQVTLYSPSGRSLRLQSDHRSEFRVGRMKALYRYLLEQAIRAGAQWMPETSFLRAEADGRFNWVELSRLGKRFSTRTQILIGADGAVSRVAPQLGLDENDEWLAGVENVYRGVTLTPTPQLHCFVDPRLAPGYLAWAVDDGEDVHVGVGGYGARFQPGRALEELEKRLRRTLGLVQREPDERRGGKIPVNGVLRRIGNRRGLLIGDAAGAVSPLTAGGLDAALRLTRFAAQLVTQSLAEGRPDRLDAYDGAPFRARFVSRLWMRRLFAQLASPLATEVAMRALHVEPFRSFARHVFFGRGSFPEPRQVLAGQLKSAGQW